MELQKIVFISYARSDQEKVKSVYQHLSISGFKPWMDVYDIYGGEDWNLSIERAIKKADFFLVCLSPNSYNKRGYLQREIRKALDRLQELLPDDIFLIPVRLENCPIPEELSKYQCLDYFETNGKDRLVIALSEGLKRRDYPEVENIIRDTDARNLSTGTENTMSQGKELKDLLIADKIDQALEQLVKTSGIDKTQLVLLQNRWSTLNHDFRYGTITREEFDTEKRQLIKIILDVI